MRSRSAAPRSNENLQSTPLAEDGFLYITDQWGVLYKIDVRSGDIGRIVWRMDPGQEKVPPMPTAAPRCGATSSSRWPTIRRASSPPTRRPARSCGRPTSSDGQVDLQFTAAPLAVKDKIVSAPPAATTACATSSSPLDAATGKIAWRKYVIPAPGEPGSETWKDKNNAWQTGGGAMWVTGSYDPATNQVLWGTGNPIPWSDPFYRPGDNLFTDSLISWDPDTRQDELVSPVHAGRHVGL